MQGAWCSHMSVTEIRGGTPCAHHRACDPRALSRPIFCASHVAMHTLVEKRSRAGPYTRLSERAHRDSVFWCSMCGKWQKPPFFEKWVSSTHRNKPHGHALCRHACTSLGYKCVRGRARALVAVRGVTAGRKVYPQISSLVNFDRH